MKRQRRRPSPKPHVSPRFWSGSTHMPPASTVGRPNTSWRSHVIATRHRCDRFRRFTSDLYRLADRLAACGVTTVAMEATGLQLGLI